MKNTSPNDHIICLHVLESSQCVFELAIVAEVTWSTVDLLEDRQCDHSNDKTPEPFKAYHLLWINLVVFKELFLKYKLAALHDQREH